MSYSLRSKTANHRQNQVMKHFPAPVSLKLVAFAELRKVFSLKLGILAWARAQTMGTKILRVLA